VLLNLPILLLMTLRGKFILSRLRYHVSFTSLLPISILGNVAGSLTPASAGDLLRTPFFRKRYDIPYAHGLAAVIYERGFSLFILGLGTGVAAAWSTLPTGASAGISVAGLAILLIAPPAVAFMLEQVRHLLPNRDDQQAARSTLRRITDALAGSLESLLLLLRDRWGTTSVALANLGIFSVMAVQMWLVVRALGLGLSPAESWMVLGTSMLAGIATLLPLGLGTLDATLAAMIGATQDGFSAGAAAAVLLRATVTLPLGLIAFVSYLFLVSGRGQPSVGDSLDASRSGAEIADD
jgi:uncharacterized protein (TIRG00374 family)